MAGQKKKEGDLCIDGLLWIGNKPKKYRTVDEFIKESRLRGCCRQLPLVPGWVEFGKTKLFLAHRDVQKTKERGCIFGYFVLQRIEIITSNRIAKELGKKAKADSLWPRNMQEYIESVKKWEEEKFSGKEIKRLLKARLQQKHMPNVAKGKTGKKPRGKRDEDKYTKLIGRVLKKVIEEWLDPRCGGSFPPTDRKNVEGHRLCSLRSKPGSVYAVDALCAAIACLLIKLIIEVLSKGRKEKKSNRQVIESITRRNKRLWERWLKKKRGRKYRWDIETLLERYEGPFRDAVEAVYRDWEPRYPVDPRLKGKVEIHGELVVFKRPFPIFEKAPQAAFLGVCQIDGDKLIEQIARRRGRKRLVVKIHYWGTKEHPETKGEFSKWLAERLDVSEACASRFLDVLAREACVQLGAGQKFKIPRIGSIKVRTIRGKKVIRFLPFKALTEYC